MIPADINILVVDDEVHITEFMENFLTRQGYGVATAHNGTEALEKFHNGRFEMVLLDLRMPGLSGMDVLRRVKDAGDHTGVIILSAFGDDETIDKALRIGADYYIQKPVELKALSRLLARWQQNREQAV